MSDLISRSALIKKIRDYADEVGCVRGEYELANGILKAISVVEDAPTVEAKPVVRGYVKTVVGKMGVMNQECSVCGNALEWKAYPNYCDECGVKLDSADMRGGKNE